MKNSRMKMTAVLLTTAFALTGCGDALYELEPEEEAAIVSYAAHAVAKYNTYQQDGEVFVMQEVLDGEEAEEPSADVQEEGQTEEQVSTEGQIEQIEQTDVPSAADETGSVATLTDALDLGVIQTDYMGAELCDVYQENTTGVVHPDPGKQLLVLHVNLTNTVSEKLHINIMDMQPIFKATINEETTTAALVTALTQDLGTYSMDIEPNGTNETVLLFQIPEDITEISSIQLKITMNGNKFTVNL